MSYGSKTFAGLALAMALWAGGGAAQAQDTEEAPVAASSLAAAFAAPSGPSSISLSPSGQRIALIVQTASIYRVEVRDAARPDVAVATYDLSTGREPNWVRWKGEDRVMVSVDFPTSRFGVLLNERRLVSFDVNLQNPISMNQANRRRQTWHPPLQDIMTSELADDPSGVLLTFDWEKPINPGLHRADARTGRLTEVRPGVNGVRGWLSDPTGLHLVGLGDTLNGRSALYRVRGEVVEQVAMRDVLPENIFEPLALDGVASRVVVLSNHEGGTTGAYIYDTDQSAFVQRLFKHERHDATGVRMSPDGLRAVGVTYTDDIGRVIYFDPEARARHAHIADQLASADIQILRETRDGRFVIVMTYAGDRPHQLYWLDTATGDKRLVTTLYPALQGRESLPVRAVSYQARDGLEIPAYLILPPGHTPETARNLPFVVMPHGGPHSRDDADFDFMAEFVANLGYGVLKPNFRGSSGYGETFRQAGEREWGGAILNDVVDGTRWLAAQGLADPERVCISGWSFGGYLSLIAAVEHPDLYRCAAAVAPVTDLLELIDHQSGFFGGDEMMRRMVGRAWRDRARLVQQSPLRRADEIRIPIMMVHGRRDDVVPVSHMTGMAEAMRRRSDIEPIVLNFVYADHSITRERYRLEMLQKLESFLQQSMPAPTGAAAP